MNMFRKNLLLLFFVVALTVIPLSLVQDSEFGGTDAAARKAISEIVPDYQPWFSSVWEAPGGETESLLFALQSAIGASFIGYYLGLKRGERAGRDN